MQTMFVPHRKHAYELPLSVTVIALFFVSAILYCVARMGEKRNAYRLLVGKPEGKRPLGRPRRRWMDNIKKDLSEIGVSVVDWIGLAQDRYR
jgi:hypothetical protein